MTSIPSQPADHGISTSPTCPKSPPGNFTIYDMNPVDLADHFIETIYNWRVETSIKQDLEHVPLNVGVLSTLDELVIYSPQNDCLYRYPVDAVPIEVVRQIEGLARAQDFGVGCFNQLYEVLERTVRNNSISENPEEDFGKGAKGAVAMVCPSNPPESSYSINTNPFPLLSWQSFLCRSVPVLDLTTLCSRTPTISTCMLSLLIVLVNRIGTLSSSVPMLMFSHSTKKWTKSSPSIAIHMTSGHTRTGMKESRTSGKLAWVDTQTCTGS